jgi:hypothetical protein
MLFQNYHYKYVPRRYKYTQTILSILNLANLFRDRPFNSQGGGYGFLFRSEMFFRTQELEYFFFQNLTLGYMTKTLNQIIFFFLHQNQNIFFSNIGNLNIFLEKKHNTPLQVKWPVPYRRRE